jgi:hypothetical protein
MNWLTSEQIVTILRETNKAHGIADVHYTNRRYRCTKVSEFLMDPRLRTVQKIVVLNEFYYAILNV